jgi:hypothetical protein
MSRLISSRKMTRCEFTNMKKKAEVVVDVDPLDREIDFSNSFPNPFAGRRIRNFVVIDPEMLERFPDSTAVNDALRELLALRGKAAAPKVRRAFAEVRSKKKRT